MSDRIRISVADLRAQSAELSAIATEFETQYKLAVNAIKNMKSCMSMAMAVNMIIKMSRLILFFVSLDSTLQQGITVANHAADSFENTDSALRKLFGDTLSEEVKKSPTSTQVVEIPFDTKVEQLKKVFPENSYNCNDFMSNVTNWKGQPINGKECFAMAHMMQIEVTGRRGYSIGNSVSVNDIQVGDAIYYYGDGAKPGHWVFVTAVNGDSITVAEGNWRRGTVTYGRMINKNNISLAQIDRVS